MLLMVARVESGLVDGVDGSAVIRKQMEYNLMKNSDPWYNNFYVYIVPLRQNKYKLISNKDEQVIELFSNLTFSRFLWGQEQSGRV